MKGNSQPYFSPLKALKKEPEAKQLQRSPYLRAVLTDKKNSVPARVLPMGNSTMAAALRYISNSK